MANPNVMANTLIVLIVHSKLQRSCQGCQRLVSSSGNTQRVYELSCQAVELFSCGIVKPIHKATLNPNKHPIRTESKSVLTFKNGFLFRTTQKTLLLLLFPFSSKLLVFITLAVPVFLQRLHPCWPCWWYWSAPGELTRLRLGR